MIIFLINVGFDVDVPSYKRASVSCPSPADIEATSLPRGRHLKLSSDVLLKISFSLSRFLLMMLVPSLDRGYRVKMKKQCLFFNVSSVTCVFFLLLLVCDSSAQIFGSSPVSRHTLVYCSLFFMQFVIIVHTFKRVKVEYANNSYIYRYEDLYNIIIQGGPNSDVKTFFLVS